MRCSLEASEIPERGRAMAELGTALVAVEAEGRTAAFRFGERALPEVERFVRDESRCCPFFQFDVDRGGGEVRLEVGVPEGGEPILRGLVAGFAAGWRVF
jgi:hypothetical protein